jgi:hypothetical protein
VAASGSTAKELGGDASAAIADVTNLAEAGSCSRRKNRQTSSTYRAGASIAAKCPYLVDHVADVHPLSS